MFDPYAERRNSSEQKRSIACHLVLDLNQMVLKFLVFIQWFSLTFSLCFITSVDVYFVLFSSLISMNFSMFMEDVVPVV